MSTGTLPPFDSGPAPSRQGLTCLGSTRDGSCPCHCIHFLRKASFLAALLLHVRVAVGGCSRQHAPVEGGKAKQRDLQADQKKKKEKRVEVK